MELKNQILKELKNSGIDMEIVQEIHIESQGMSAQIDFYVVTPKMNFVILCENITDPFAQCEHSLLVIKKKKTEYTGMIHQKAMERYFEIFHKALVVLENPNTILNSKITKKDLKNKVIRVEQLAKTIKKIYESSEIECRSKEEMKLEADGMLAQAL